jgi:hypothetical protein
MVDVEDQILYNGFSTSNEKESGTFKDDGYPHIRWETLIERVELPTDLAQKTPPTRARKPRTRCR